MADPVSLCNIALGQIAARAQITGLSPPAPPNNVAAQVMAQLYQVQADAIFRAAHWNCARKQAALTLLKAASGTPENPSGSNYAAPPIPWLYEYGYPDDCLKVRFVMPLPNPQLSGQIAFMTNVGVSYMPLVNTSMPFVPAVDTDQDGNQIRVILSNARQAQAVYTARIANVDLWDPNLQNAVIGALAAWAAPAVSGSMERQKLAVAMAANLITAARINDGNEGITSADIIPDWMRVRDGGNGFWGGEGHIANWDAWGGPDGVSY